MKVVLDTMLLWVSYCTRRHGSRHRLIDRALKARVRLFVSDYILDELAEVLHEDLGESVRFVHLARRAVLRRAKRTGLPTAIRDFVPDDPKDNPIVQTAILSKSNYLVTADVVLLELAGACPNLLAEACLYRYDAEKNSETPVDEHHHALAALRYFNSRSPRRAADEPSRELMGNGARTHEHAQVFPNLSFIFMPIMALI